MTALLASVRSREEAALALAGGADLIDLKEPSRGALGALPPETVAELVRFVAGKRPVSATLGDLPMVPALLRSAAERLATSGVDYIKVGLYPSAQSLACVQALAPLARRGSRLVAVLFADRAPDWGWLAEIAAAGFSGVMLDTADKRRGSLRIHLDEEALSDFVGQARSRALTVGLAGSLGEEDIGPLKTLAPDFLGFRGALCGKGERTGEIDPARIAAIRARLRAAV